MLKLGRSHGADSLDGETDSANHIKLLQIRVSSVEEGPHDTMGACPGGLLYMICKVVF